MQFGTGPNAGFGVFGAKTTGAAIEKIGGEAGGVARRKSDFA